jgi:hypothetical protein
MWSSSLKCANISIVIARSCASWPPFLHCSQWSLSFCKSANCNGTFACSHRAAVVGLLSWGTRLLLVPPLHSDLTPSWYHDRENYVGWRKGMIYTLPLVALSVYCLLNLVEPSLTPMGNAGTLGTQSTKVGLWLFEWLCWTGVGSCSTTENLLVD